MSLTFMCKLLKIGMWEKGNEENNNLNFRNEIRVIRCVFDDNDKNEKNHERYNCKWQFVIDIKDMTNHIYDKALRTRNHTIASNHIQHKRLQM